MLFTPARFWASLASLREHRFVTFAVLTDTIGAGLTLPLTIVYFTITTHVPLAVIGVLSTVASLVALPIGLVGGSLTDRFGAKASMILNNLLSAAGFALYLFAHDPVMIFAAIFLANASERLYWTSWTAYVHDLAAGRPFERWFAFLEATKAAALGTGAIIAAITLANGHQDGLRWLVLANVTTSIAAAVVFATQRTGHRSPWTAAHADTGAADTPGSLRDFVVDRSMQLITLGQFLIGPAMVLPNVAFSVLFIQRWGMSPAVAPVQFAIATGLSALFQTSVTRWVAGRQRGTLIALGAVLTAATAAPLIVLPQLHGLAAWSYVVAVAILLAAADMIYLPAANAVMAEAPHPRIRGRAIGVFQTASSIGMALFPLTLGLMDSRTPWLLWLIATGVFLIAAWVWSAGVRGLPQRVQIAELNDIDA
ncbi:MFS transporter [Curtobacterium sp. MCBD17_040]|uniref:MFS transporter n=1 Tax=Curtobacterium sp. MCBD17_040 TaxID=2175674 RepID=UPI000DAA77AB|nr:MFS transporter [Curtobacterium sp. MCBD17_040]WIB65786.1 MFS transporter [Curtobacterium sp. MCBD17_040]